MMTHWTSEQDEIVRSNISAYAAVLRLRGIGYHRTTQAVSSRRNQLRQRGVLIPRRFPTSIDLYQAEAIVADALAGMYVRDIAAKFGVSTDTVRARLQRARVPEPKPPRCRKPPKPRKPPEPKSAADRAISAANRRAGRMRRAQVAWHRQSAAAAEVLKRLPPSDSVAYMVLRLRADNPDSSLAELAKMCVPPLTKDAYTGRLRRALNRRPR